nr:MAG TPA: hypothetical protein [Caudoviricetes sp.]
MRTLNTPNMKVLVELALLLGQKREKVLKWKHLTKYLPLLSGVSHECHYST